MTEFFVLMLLFALIAFGALAYLWIKLSPYFPNGIMHALKEQAPPPADGGPVDTGNPK